MSGILGTTSQRFGFLSTLAIVSASLVAVWIAGLLVVGKRTGLPHITPVFQVEHRQVYEHSLRDPGSADLLFKELQIAKLDGLRGEDQIIQTLAWTMSQTSHVADNRAVGGWALLSSARAGGGFICGDLADLFRESLLVLGIPARRVHLIRDLFNEYDRHVLVEVWLDGRWQVFDPTFNIVLETDSGHRVGAATAKDWFSHKVGQRVKPRFLGEVPYPVRITTYPTKYEDLFVNVFYEVRRGQDYLRVLPLAGFVLAPEWAYWGNHADISDRDISLYRGIYNTLIIYIPIALALLLSSLVIALVQRARSARTQVREEIRVVKKNNSV